MSASHLSLSLLAEPIGPTPVPAARAGATAQPGPIAESVAESLADSVPETAALSPLATDPSAANTPPQGATPAEPLRLTPSQAAALDDPATWGRHTRWLDPELPQTGDLGGSAGAEADAASVAAVTGSPTAPVHRRAQSRWLISGIHCAACAGLIESALLQQPGVLRAEVNGAAERALIDWQPGLVRMSQLIAAVHAAGYGAFPDDGAQALEAHRLDARDSLWRLFVAAFCMMQVMMYAAPAYVSSLADMGADTARLLRWASWLLSVPVMLFSAKPFLVGAWRSLRQRRIGMDVPVALGLVVTFVASSQAAFAGAPDSEIYFDSLTMFVTVLLAARWLEGVARRRAARSLDALMRRLPDAVERLGAHDQVELVSASALQIGDRIRVPVGQAFAADGTVLTGSTHVDESMLTGESLPVAKPVGAAVLAGCLNLGAPVSVQVTALGRATRYQRIVELVEQALTQRPQALLSADRWAGPFLWLVLALALAAYAVWHVIDPSRALWVAVSVLIVTCPCALSIGAPVAYLAAAGRLARDGILVQRLDALEVLASSNEIVFDKTGTLTEDSLGLRRTVMLGPLRRETQAHMALLSATAPCTSVPDDVATFDASDSLTLAASLAAQSTHPVSRALVRSARQTEAMTPGAAAASALRWERVAEQPGCGLEGWLQDGSRWRLGQQAWLQGDDAVTVDLAARHARDPNAEPGGPSVSLAWWDDGAMSQQTGWRTVARFDLREAPRPDAQLALQALQDAGVSTHLVSGDRAANVAALAHTLGMPHWQAACTPEDKLATLQALQASGPVVMVGDGINDAPVLARADVSIAMGSAATLAQAHADVIILANRLLDIVHLRDVARRTHRIVRQNLSWAVFYNLACVPLALMGWLPPWAAGLGMAASSLLVVLNALRLARA